MSHLEMDGDDEASFEEIKSQPFPEEKETNLISKKSKKKSNSKKEVNDPETIEKMLKRARESMQEDGSNFPVKYADMKYLEDLDLSMGELTTFELILELLLIFCRRICRRRET